MNVTTCTVTRTFDQINHAILRYEYKLMCYKNESLKWQENVLNIHSGSKIISTRIGTAQCKFDQMSLLSSK